MVCVPQVGLVLFARWLGLQPAFGLRCDPQMRLSCSCCGPQVGSGPELQQGQTATMGYIGTLDNGKVFDQVLAPVSTRSLHCHLAAPNPYPYPHQALSPVLPLAGPSLLQVAASCDRAN